MIFFWMLVMNIFYAGSTTFMKFSSQEIHPFQIVFLRHFLAFLAFTPFFLKSPIKKIRLQDLLFIMVSTFFAFTVASVLQIWSMQISYASDGSMIMAMEPIFVILLAVIFLKEKINYKMGHAILLGCLGFLVLTSASFNHKLFASGRLWGNLLFLAAILSEASFPIFLKSLLKRYPPITIAFYSLLCASLYMLPFQFFLPFKNPMEFTSLTWISILYLAWGCSFLACFLWINCLSHANASFVALSWFIQPAFGAVFASFLLQESLSVYFWLGGAFIVFALGLIIPEEQHALEHKESVIRTHKVTTQFLFHDKPVLFLKSREMRKRAIQFPQQTFRNVMFAHKRLFHPPPHHFPH